MARCVFIYDAADKQTAPDTQKAQPRVSSSTSVKCEDNSTSGFGSEEDHAGRVWNLPDPGSKDTFQGETNRVELVQDSIFDSRAKDRGTQRPS